MNGFHRAAAKDYGVLADESRYTAWFDMHNAEFSKAYGKAAGIGDAQHEWLSVVHPFPVYMLDAEERYPSSVSYPVLDVIQEAGRDYFTSTVAYMLAMAFALTDEVGEVALFGIDLVHDTEYGNQRPCAEYWIGRLESAGVRVTLHEDSALCKHVGGRYGYESGDPFQKLLLTQLRLNESRLSQGLDAYRAQIVDIQNQMHVDNGALQAIRSTIDNIEAYARGGCIDAQKGKSEASK